MDKISNMNDELDLGVKIIDDSFEISGIENDYHGILNGVQDGDDRFSNRTNNQTVRYNNEDVIVMDESVISPQC